MKELLIEGKELNKKGGNNLPFHFLKQNHILPNKNKYYKH